MYYKVFACDHYYTIHKLHASATRVISSPANPALTVSDPLSMTRAVTSSSVEFIIEN